MQTMSQIRQRREEILREVAGLEFIRRGSVTEQVLHPRGRNGRQYTCGPYPLYSFKRKGRTLSRRLSAAESGRIRTEVEAGHRFQDLMQELMELGEAACGLGETRNAEKKTPNS
jgi:hypothetical protein